jgi:hypothetical protein
VANRDTGLLSCIGTVTLPAPTRIVGAPLPVIAVGAQVNVAGTVLDGTATDLGCGHEGIAVTLAASAGHLATPSLVSDEDGLFRTPFTAPDVAGPVTITASAATPPILGTWTVSVRPIVNNAAPAHVDKAGGTPVTITGRGFAAGATAVTFNGVLSQTPPQVHSSTSLTVEAPPAATSGPASVVVTVSGIAAASAPQVTYVPAFGPVFTFTDAKCGAASLAADVFGHNGLPVAGQPVALSAVAGSFVTASGVTPTLAANTNASGRVSAKMETASAAATAIAVSGHTQTRPTPEESASVQVIAKATCDRFTNFGRRNLLVRVTIGEELISSVIDGCRACVDPSRFRVHWQTPTPILAGLSVTALTDDAAIARNVRVTVLGADKAAAILKRAPAAGQAVTLIELAGDLAKARVALTYADAVEKNERVSLFQLKADKWVAVAPIDAAAKNLAARVSAAGTYAIVAR